jgi:antitoxin component of MazEF toxin-antitoxin module
MNYFKSVHILCLPTRSTGVKMMCKELENSDLNPADKAPQYDLDQMIKEMTPDTFPDIIDWGEPVGQELH